MPEVRHSNCQSQRGKNIKKIGSRNYYAMFTPLLNSKSNRFPFDWKNPFGYGIAVLLQLKMVSLPLRYIASNLTLAFTGFLFALSIAKDIKVTAHSMSERAKASTLSEKTMSTLYKQFCDLIRFTSMKPLSIFHAFRKIFSYVWRK